MGRREASVPVLTSGELGWAPPGLPDLRCKLQGYISQFMAHYPYMAMRGTSLVLSIPCLSLKPPICNYSKVFTVYLFACILA